MLPSTVARDLDRDPEQSALTCLRMLQYAEAKNVFDTNDPKMIASYRGPTMDAVKRNAFAIVQQQLDRERGES